MKERPVHHSTLVFDTPAMEETSGYGVNPARGRPGSDEDGDHSNGDVPGLVGWHASAAPSSSSSSVSSSSPEEHQPDAVLPRKPSAEVRADDNTSSVPPPPPAPQPPPPAQQQQPSPLPLPAFDGDVSAWGRTRVSDSDDDNDSTAGDDQSLSSGVSPRAMRPRRRTFDHDAARRSLAHSASAYGRAQALRRSGGGNALAFSAATAAATGAGELPAALAAEQLRVLAGMAGKVQEAIAHSRRIFERRAAVEASDAARGALAAWRATAMRASDKRARLARATARLARGTLARAFGAWRARTGAAECAAGACRKAAAAIARGRARRCLAAWRALLKERWWKRQCALREREALALEAALDGLQRRAAYVMQRRRWAAALRGWRALAAERRAVRARCANVARRREARGVAAAWRAWLSFLAAHKQQRDAANRALAHAERHALAAVWGAWAARTADKRAGRRSLGRAKRAWARALLRRVWSAWLERRDARRRERVLAATWQRPLLARAMSAWCAQTRWQQYCSQAAPQAAARGAHRRLLALLRAWQWTARGLRLQCALAAHEEAQRRLLELGGANARLRRDNERFAWLIDSGEWGRGRVAELAAAGEALRAERDALLELLQGLRGGGGGGANDDGGATAGQPSGASGAGKLSQARTQATTARRRGGADAVGRNEMFVRSGSSFNALVRALKQDVLGGGGGDGAGEAVVGGGVNGGGRARHSAELLYEIDRLSLNRVSLSPDSQLRVRAVASPLPFSPSSPGGGGGGAGGAFASVARSMAARSRRIG